MLHLKNYRFLNCAASKTEEDTDQDGSIRKPWRVCTVKEVEDFKSLIKMLPIWSTALLVSVPLAIQLSMVVIHPGSDDGSSYWTSFQNSSRYRASLPINIHLHHHLFDRSTPASSMGDVHIPSHDSAPASRDRTCARRSWHGRISAGGGKKAENGATA